MVLRFFALFLKLQRARTAKKIETPADIEGFPEMKDEEKDEIRKLIAEFEAAKPAAKSPAKAGKAGKTGKTGSKASKGGASGTTQLFGSPAPKPSSGVIHVFHVYILYMHVYINVHD